MALAALGETGYWIVIGAWVGLCVLIFLFSPRDLQGRKRATGCAFFLAVFFGAIFLAFAAWAADNIF